MDLGKFRHFKPTAAREFLQRRLVCGGFAILLFFTSTNAIQCVSCPSSESNHECNMQGTTQKCASDQDVCFTEVRVHGGVYKIRKGCSQSLSCAVQRRQNQAPGRDWRGRVQRRCNDGYDNSVCNHCCSYDHCNLVAAPSFSAKGGSCTHFFPGCRDPKWKERGGFLIAGAVFQRCHCDKDCVEKEDCCFDFHDVCVGVLPRGMPDKYGGTTGGERYKKTRKGGDMPLLRCFTCENASSNEQCNEVGRIVECHPNQRSCLTRVVQKGEARLITKRCSHKPSCEALQRGRKSCRLTGGVCYSCCDVDYCNFFEDTRKKNFSASCLTTYPGFPQCRRQTTSPCEKTPRCKSSKVCRCDSDCVEYNDCCDDHIQLCKGPEPASFRWVMEEAFPAAPMLIEGGDRSRLRVADEPISTRVVNPVNESSNMEIEPEDVERMQEEKRRSEAALVDERANRGRTVSVSTARDLGKERGSRKQRETTPT